MDRGEPVRAGIRNRSCEADPPPPDSPLFYDTPRVPAASSNPLSSYIWKKRLIVCYFPQNAESKAALKDLENSIQEFKAEILDRDLLLFHVGELPKRGKASYAVSLPSEAQADLRERYGLTGDTAQLLLIGKDGGVKQRQTAPNFSLQRMYALIDTMPMRQEEMRSR